MSGRLPKTGDMKRVHTHMPPDWLKTIGKAAKAKLMSRSYYIATAAIKQAIADNSKGVKATTK